MHASREPSAANPSQVLVVGKSPVNRVVIAKIVERSGLKPLSETPDDALRILSSLQPAVVILDGGADNNDCARLLTVLRDNRRVSANNLPSIILLSTGTKGADVLAANPGVDAVVAKPITTETLQPVIDRLMLRSRG